MLNRSRLLRAQEPYDYKKSVFMRNLKTKSKNIKDNRVILFMKHKYLKKIVNAFQISVIFASTIVTFFESIQNNIRLGETEIKILAICLSTYIAIFTAIYKFIKIDDKKEEIYKLLQTFNDIENVIMNKIEKISLLQDRFQDEMKINMRSPYILNPVYNKISEEEDEDDDHHNNNNNNNNNNININNNNNFSDMSGGNPTSIKTTQPTIDEEENEEDDEEDDKEETEHLYSKDDKITTKKLDRNCVSIDMDNVYKNNTMEIKPLSKSKYPASPTRLDDLQNHVCEPSSPKYYTRQDKNKKLYIDLNENENYKVYVKLLKKYEAEFQEIVRDYENASVDKRILTANTFFDTLLSYNEIIYYKGKIVESLLLENMHKKNRDLIELPLETLEQYKHEMRQLRMQHHRSGISDDDRHEIEERIEEIMQNTRRLMHDDNDQTYENNFFNNLCLFFSNLCRFCLIMKLYFSLSSRTRKIRRHQKDIKGMYDMESYDSQFMDNMEKSPSCCKKYFSDCCC